MKKLLFILLGFAMSLSGFGQDKMAPRVDIQYVYTNGRPPMAKVLIRKRIDRRYYPIQGLQVKIYFNEETDENKIAEMTTNEKGLANGEFPEQVMKGWDSLDTFDLYVALEETDSSEEVSESITVAKARLVVNGEIRDETKMVTARVEQSSGGQWNPVGGVEVKLFVNRDFGKLPLGEDAYETDGSGYIEAPFDMEIPGNEQGEISVGAFVEEHGDFGTLYALKEVGWGTPTVDNNMEFNRRTLWASRDKTPLWLLIFPNLMILGVWGAIAYLLWQIYLLKKMANKT